MVDFPAATPMGVECSVQREIYNKKKRPTFVSRFRGTTRSRTGDTRIFSPLLYQLSYGTIVFGVAKVDIFFNSAKFHSKKIKKSAFLLFDPKSSGVEKG